MALRRGPAGEDGAHAFAYNTRTPGAYSITATVGGAHVRGSPARVSASVAEAHAPLCEVVGGAGLERGAVAGARPPVAYTLNPVCCRVEPGWYRWQSSCSHIAHCARTTSWGRPASVSACICWQPCGHMMSCGPVLRAQGRAPTWHLWQRTRQGCRSRWAGMCSLSPGRGQARTMQPRPPQACSLMGQLPDAVEPQFRDELLPSVNLRLAHSGRTQHRQLAAGCALM